MLKNKIGLDSSTIGDTTIDKIILQRMHQCNISEFKDYLQLISCNQQELNELLEITVIPETWFFRDIRPYEFIHNHIQKTHADNPSATFRILSIPSSTGEEPYSLAMYLLDKDISENTFSIDAVDVSQRALAYAKKGHYGNNSFRGKHYSPYQKKYFTKDDKGYKINQIIQNKISFYPLNILHKQANIKYKFDFILCRNLLIYFDVKTKLSAFKNLASLLKDNGYLFVGHSEFGSVPDDIYQNTGFEQAFALIKHNHPEFQTKTTNQHEAIKPHKPDSLKPRTVNKASNFEDLIIKPEKTSNTSTTLEQINQLADSLEYEKAETACLLYINERGEDADVLYFLGLIASCQHDNSAAEKHLRKSIFLNPVHYESLIHLSLILEKTGDSKSAGLFKKRAHKVFSNQNNTQER